MNQPDHLPENFRPRIVKGRIFPKGRNFIYRDISSSRQVELPLSMADMVLLCDGNHTIQQILTKVYEKQKVVQFQKILDTLFVLYRHGLLENSLEFEEQRFFPRIHKILNYRKNLFTLTSDSANLLSSELKTLLLSGVLFCNLVVIAFSLFSKSSFLLSSQFETQLSGLGLGALLAVILVNLRSVVYFAFDSIIMSTPPALTFRLGLKEPGFVSDLEGSVSELNFTQRLSYLFGYISIPSGLSLTLLPLFFGNVSPLNQSLFFSLSLVLLYDLYPHSKRSAGRSLLKELERIPDGSDLTDFGLFLSKSSRKFELGKSVAGLAWSALALLLFGTLFERIEDPSSWPPSQILLGFGFVMILLYAHQSLNGLWLHRFSTHFDEKAGDKEDIVVALDLLERVSLFSEIGESYLKILVEISELETIEPGEIVFKEGDDPKDLYLLVSGSCSVKNGSLSAEINSGSVFGESALLETGVRQATVTARSKILVLKMPISKISEVLSESGHFESLKSQIIVNQYFCSSKHFQKIRRSTIEKLERSGKIQTYGEGVTLFQQGDVGDGIYLIVRGSVETRISDDRKCHLKQGDLFGEISVLARIPRTATVVTLEPCLLFKVAPDSFWEILLADLNFAYQIEKLSETRLSQDLDALLGLEKVG